MKLLRSFAVLFTAVFLFAAGCKKELSCEDCQAATANGAINCDSFIVHGNYSGSTAFTDTNYIAAIVNVAATGAYTIYSDTINGYFFYSTGIFKDTGIQQVVLKAFGQVSADEISNFTFYFGSIVCTHNITSLQAAYTFAATDGNCDNNIVYGNYIAGTALINDDSVVVQVNVTTTGNYNLQTEAINGMIFTASGVFSQTGLQTITLHGSGTPEQGATYTIPLVTPNSSCGFLIVVSYPVVSPNMYYSFEADGVAYAGILDSARLTNQVIEGDNINTLSFRTLIIAPADTVFSLGVSRVNTPVSTGTYHSAAVINEDYAGSINFSFDNEFIYGTSQSLPLFQIFLTGYGLPNRLVEGSFSGPVMDGENKTINITNGKFKTYLRH